MLTRMLTPCSVTGRRESHFSLQSGFPGFPAAHCFNVPIKLCSSLCAKIVCPVALLFTWSKRIPQIVALGGRWQLLCNRFSRFLLDLDGLGCHLGSISGTEISHWPLWATFGAYCQVWRKEWGCSDLHLPFQRTRRMLWGNLCDCCWPIHSRGTTGAPHLSIYLRVGIKSVSTKNIPLLHTPEANQGGLFCWAKLDSAGLVATLC